MNKAGIIGRFNPLCQNHVDLFRQALKGNDELLIGIGQKNLRRAKEVFQYKEQIALYELNYLFPFEQTKEWIEAVLPNKKVTVVPIPDIFDKEHYANHVEECFRKAGKEFQEATVWGENPDTYDCFTDYDMQIAKDTLGYHATDVRQEILLYGNSNRTAVPLTREQRATIIDAEREKKQLTHIVEALKTGKIAYSGFNKYLNKVTPEGHPRDVILTRDAVEILYVDDENNVYLNKQYRSGTNRMTLGTAAGMTDKKGVSYLEIAVEELAEEQGIVVKPEQVTVIGKYAASEGQMSEEVTLFIAKGPATFQKQQLEANEENIEVIKMPLDEALQQQYSSWRAPMILQYAKNNI